MASSRIFVKFCADKLAQTFLFATRANDSAEVKKLAQLADMGNRVWRSWAESGKGEVIELGTGNGMLEVEADALADLEAIAKQYAGLIGETLSVGVGKDISESDYAFQLAKEKGGNRLCYYTKTTNAELRELREKSEESSLAKTSGAGGHTLATKPVAGSEPHEEAATAKAYAVYQNPEPEMTHAADDSQELRSKFRQLADTQEVREKAQKVNGAGDVQKLKEQTAAVLQSLKEQLPVLAQLKDTYPDTYKSVLALVQSVIAMGRELSGAEDKLNKAEKAPRRMKKEMGSMASVPNDSDFGGFHKKDLLPGGAADGMTPDEFNDEDLEEGTSHEMEHTDNQVVAREIAMDHLKEDPDYYRKLKTIEKADRWLHATSKKNAEEILKSGVLKASPTKKVMEKAAAWAVPAMDEWKEGVKGWGRTKAMADRDAPDESVVLEFGADHRPKVWERDASQAYWPTDVKIKDAKVVSHEKWEPKEELDPTEDPKDQPADKLDKTRMEAHGPRLDLPVGTVWHQRIKVRHYDGSTSWKSVKAGMVLALDPAHHAISSREPGGR